MFSPKNIPHCSYRGQFISAYEENSHLLWEPSKTHTYTGHKAVVECCHITDLNENHMFSVLSFNAWNSLCLVDLKFLPSVEHNAFLFHIPQLFRMYTKLFTSVSLLLSEKKNHKFGSYAIHVLSVPSWKYSSCNF